jgi:flagellar assembly protein FliH
MSLLPNNIYKYNSLNDNVQAYHPICFGKESKPFQGQEPQWFYTTWKVFSLEEAEEEKVESQIQEENHEVSLQEEEEFEEEVSLSDDILQQARDEAEKILKEAREQAEKILAEARLEAQRLKEEAMQEGLEQGRLEGEQTAYQEHRQRLDEECNLFLNEFQRVITETELKKLEIFQQYRTELKDLAIAVAEKVIQVSLRSSGDVIEKMIIAATEKLKSKLWAKIYIAKCDANLMVQGNSDLMKHISHISDHIKIIIMENENPGTCIIEFPDEVIDASASTQVENIKEILNSAGI